VESLELYNIAENDGIEIHWFELPNCSALTEYLYERYYIGLDTHLSQAQEKVALAHELGHCKTDALYGRDVSTATLERSESRAEKWSVTQLISFDDLLCAFKKGNCEVWELAEYFDMPEDFIRTTLDVYRRLGDLA